MAPSIALPALLLARAPLGLSGSSVAPHPSVHPAAFGEGGERPPPLPLVISAFSSHHKGMGFRRS